MIYEKKGTDSGCYNAVHHVTRSSVTFDVSFETVTVCTVMCLNIGPPNTINFPFVPNGKLMIFRCSYI